MPFLEFTLRLALLGFVALSSTQSITFAFVPEKFTLTAKLMTALETERVLRFVENVELKSVSDTSTLNCSNLELYSDEKGNTHHFVATGNVLLFDNDYKMKSDSLLMNKVNQNFKLEGNVKVDFQELHLIADKLDYDYQKKLGRVSAIKGRLIELKSLTKNDEKTREIELKSQKMRFREKFNQLILQGKVSAYDASNNTQIYAKRVEILADEKQQIKELIAKGNVKIEQENRSSKSREAIINFVSETVTLIGDAQVKEEGRINLSSEIIKMFLEVDKGIIQSEDQKPVKVEIPL